MKTFVLTIGLLVSLASNAQVIKSNKDFKNTGTLSGFQWAPERYQSRFRYDLIYYIPNSLKDQKNVKSLIFLHGGGASTATRAGAIDAVKLYANDLMKMANELGFVLIMPSSNGLQWSGHTRGMLRDISTKLRTDLDIDPNLIGVAGHSMGGMGITRSYHLGADEFAFYMPMASGIDTTKAWNWTTEFIYKVFNVPYIQLQGKNDHFDIFVKRNVEHLARVKELEAQYGEKSKFDVIFYDGDHNYNYKLTRDTLKKLYSSPRDLYQKHLYGSIYTANFTRTEYQINYNQDSEPRYFWVEFNESDLTEPEETNFIAKIVGQEIHITIPTLPVRSKNMRIYLSERMLDLKQEVRIYLNDSLVSTVGPSDEIEKNFDPKDSAFIFNQFVDIKF